MASPFLLLVSGVLLGISCASTVATDPNLKMVGPLPPELTECSGMIQLANDLYGGVNDSGHPAEIIVFSLKQKTDSRKVKILDAGNHDWEELTTDDQFIYIGDTGNNSGNRKDLVIYRAKKDDVIKETQVKVDKISFYYPEQLQFSPSNRHNFDCEAMVCSGDSLYLFTKNRGNLKTDLYSVPKIPGNYAARHLGQFDAKGLITGACLRPVGLKYDLALIGYTNEKKDYMPFLIYFPQIEGVHFFNSLVNRQMFHANLQTETILFDDEHHVYISNEEEHQDPGFVYRVDIQD